jgi:hypothetical protein
MNPTELYRDGIAYQVAEKIEERGYTVADSTGVSVNDLVGHFCPDPLRGIGILCDSPRQRIIMTKKYWFGRTKKSSVSESRNRLIATIGFGTNEAGDYTNDWFVKIYGSDIRGFAVTIIEDLMTSIDPLRIKPHYELVTANPRYETSSRCHIRVATGWT